MKHLKQFEAQIEKSFVDWLKNPRAPITHIYNFKFPVKKVYNLDDTKDINSESLIDFLKYERGNDILQTIANTLDLGFESELKDEYTMPKLSKEEVEANFNKYFEAWLEQEFDGDRSKFYRLYDLDFEEYELSDEDFENLKNNFNEQNIEKDYPFREFSQNFRIIELEIISIEDGNIIVGKIETNRKLTTDDLDSVRDWLEGQLSDEWGKEFTETPDEEENYGLNFITYIYTWWETGFPSWYLNLE